MRHRTELMQQILTSDTAQKIIDYVSPIYGDSYVGLWIFQAIGTALDDVFDIAEKLRYETNPATAELLLDHWERRYGLSMDGSLDTEQRRARILAKKNSRGPCNPARMAAAVSAALGGAKVEVSENVGRNRFSVHVLESVDSLAPAVATIERMKPAHLIYDINITVHTNTTSDIKAATALTHYEGFVLDVVEPAQDPWYVYADGETLVIYGNNVSVDDKTLVFHSRATADNGTLIIG